MAYNIPVIRQLLTEAFGDEDLRTFCFDHFRAVYEEFTTGMAKGLMVQLLLDHADRQREMERLLGLVAQINPARYALYAGCLITPEPTPPPSEPLPALGPGRPVSAGLTVLLELIQQPAVHSAVVVFRTDFEAARQQIGILARCKLLHDLFQRLQDRYRLIDCDRKRLPGDATAWESLELNRLELEGVVGDLLEIARRPADTEAWWPDQISQARDDFHRAVEGCAVQPLQAALQRLNRVLAREPSRVNTRLVAAAGALRLGAIGAAISDVLQHLSDADTQAVAVQQLREGQAALVRLDGNLRALVEHHNAWQAVADELARIEGNLGQDIAELALAWPDVEAMTVRLSGEDGADWAQALKVLSTDLQAALVAGDPARARRLFQRYRSQANRRFNQVNQELLTLCEELQRIGEPLDLLLGAL